jgi:hypothetical protein
MIFPVVAPATIGTNGADLRILLAPAGLLLLDIDRRRSMKRNVGMADRVARGLGALALFTCAVAAPLPLGVRLAAFSLPGVYLLFTALAGSCFGYRLMGKSTCAPRS